MGEAKVKQEKIRKILERFQERREMYAGMALAGGCTAEAAISIGTDTATRLEKLEIQEVTDDRQK